MLSGRSGVVVATAVLSCVCMMSPAGATARSTTAVTPSLAPDSAPTHGTSGELRVNEGGWLSGETKRARLMTSAPVRHARFEVVAADGSVALRGPVPTRSGGRWSARYPDVYVLDLTALRRPGSYHLVTSGDVRTTSARFAVTDAGSVFGTLVADGVRFDQTQRDGADVVPGPLHREPSHLLDRHATVYAWPTMAKGSDLILDADLRPTGGPVDVAGGWFDAGDYLKFTHSAAYADVALWTSARLLGDRAPAGLVAEARYGERWLEKMWDPATGVLYLQVGIGSGNRAGTFSGDHDLWRLPQADDADTAERDRYVSHRPVFAANAPGARISPNLVGRTSAAFALAARSDAATDPARARHELALAESLYARAATDDPPKPLVTALPHAFYPESTWRDDMELGAAEIALAAQALGRPSAAYVVDSARWARGFVAARVSDTLNLYDTAALAHVALAHAMAGTSHGRLAVSRGDLLADLRRQIATGVARAAADPFGAAADVDAFDVNSHSYGLVATVALYDGLTGTSRYQGFASGVRTWLLGGDPWGVTSMVGVGERFPDCMQHQVANLSGSLDGSPPVDVGAVVNGPNGRGSFEGGLGGFQGGMRRCTSPQLTAYDGQGSRYVDDVRAWQTDEPALDMTGAAILAGAAQLALHPGASIPTGATR